MKELSIEQKAKAYDEALERAKKWYNAPNVDKIPTFGNRVIEEIFPELKESEDERIRKALVEMVHDTTGDSLWIDYNVHKEDALAWLEKQGEVESDNDDIEVEEKGIRESFNKIEDEKQCKQKPQRMISAEAKEAMYDKPADKVEPKFKVKYAGSEYNVLEIKDIAGVAFYGIEDEPNHIDYVKAENCEIIDGYAIKENGSPYPTKSAVFFGAKNPTWSKEDDVMIYKLLAVVELYYDRDGDDLDKQSCIDWLKALKQRCAWKPSDEQLEALKNAIHIKPFENPSDNPLWGLYEQLKKLKEE